MNTERRSWIYDLWMNAPQPRRSLAPVISLGAYELDPWGRNWGVDTRAVRPADAQEIGLFTRTALPRMTS